MAETQDEIDQGYREGASISPNELNIQFGIPREEINSFRNLIRVYPCREVIIKEGDQEKALYLLRVGTVEVYKGDGDARKLVGTVDAVNFFGEMSMINDEPRSATVTALTSHVVVYRIAHPNIQSILTNPKWAELLLTRLTKNLARSLESNIKLAAQVNEMSSDLERTKKDLAKEQTITSQSSRNIRLAFNGILYFENVIHGTAVVGTKGWAFLNALTHVTRNLMTHYFSHIDQTDKAVDVNVIRRSLATLPRDDQAAIMEDLNKLL